MDIIKELQKDFSGLTELQKIILLKMTIKIIDCEGKGMPEEYWCAPCKATKRRMRELFNKFKIMNASVLPKYTYTYNSGYYGFDDA